MFLVYSGETSEGQTGMIVLQDVTRLIYDREGIFLPSDSFHGPGRATRVATSSW